MAGHSRRQLQEVEALLLAIDVGNSNLTIGVFEGEQLHAHGRFSTRRDATPDELGGQLLTFLQQRGLPVQVKAVAISCVVPTLNQPLLEMAQTYLGLDALLVGPGTRTGMEIHYDPPRDVGADRIVTAVGVHHRYGGPAIMVSFGTATVFDAIDQRGNYLGGAITPGLQLSVDALFSRASRLPRVDLAAPPKVLGRTTVTSMQAGIMYGAAAQAEGLIERMRGELGVPLKVVATGGLAPLVAPLVRGVDVIDTLVLLEGLRVLEEMNRPRI
ncbi:MAG TPA: type III pantothenate kinase [Candidatus Dormibacteraeota bacterium]|nr:type III pantothenate kinase [Candidatus Dormibacteraeota bacterium]